jgi:hypothetical protein
MRTFSFVICLLLAAMPAVPQEPQPQQEEPVTTVIVPVVGSVLGMNGVTWKTDVILANDLGAEVVVALQLPTAPESPAIVLTLGPGQSQRFTDVAGEAFGLEAALSPLLVTTSGRRSVTIHATVYGVRGTEVSPAQPIAVQYGPAFSPFRMLDGLTFDDAVRTNIGLANLGEREADVVLALQRVAGRHIATTRVKIPPLTLWHTSIQHLFPLISKGTDFSILVETSAPDTHVYASVIENETNAARFIQPRAGTQ